MNHSHKDQRANEIMSQHMSGPSIAWDVDLLLGIGFSEYELREWLEEYMIQKGLWEKRGSGLKYTTLAKDIVYPIGWLKYLEEEDEKRQDKNRGKMTDDQIINRIVLWMKDTHHPAPAPVGGMLLKHYSCNESRKWVIISKIEEYGFAKLYDLQSGSDMVLTAYGIHATESGDPMSHYKKSIEDKNKANIQGENIFYNSGNITSSNINQSIDSLSQVERPINHPIIAETHKANIIEKLWAIISKNPLISAAVATVVSALILKVIDYYLANR